MLEWFTTIPGILIICGVILLVIAIVLFVLGSKKDSKSVVSSPVNNVETPAPVQNVEVQPVVNEPVAVEPVAVAPVQVEQPTVTVNEPVVEPVVNAQPEVTNIVAEQPVVDNVAPAVSSVETDNTVVMTEPVVQTPVQEVTSETTSANTSVYGGEAPVVDFSVQEEKPVTIYGGNDPLEATQALPKMDESHVPYGGNYQEVKIVEPTIEPVSTTPVVEPVVNTPEVVSIPTEEVSPVVEPISISEPVVENVQPVIEPVAPAPVASVEEL